MSITIYDVLNCIVLNSIALYCTIMYCYSDFHLLYCLLWWPAGALASIMQKRGQFFYGWERKVGYLTLTCTEIIWYILVNLINFDKSKFTFCNRWSWDIGWQNLVLFYSCCFKFKYIIYVPFCYQKIPIDQVFIEIDNGKC